jgi:hypothetical protein
MRALVLALFLTAGSSSSLQAAPKPQPQIDSIVGEFFSNIEAGKNVDAMRFAMKDVAGVLGTQAVETGAAQMDGVLKSWGPAVSWQLFKSTSITSTFTRQIYYVRTKTIPYFVAIQFYNVDGNWRIVDIRLMAYNDAKSNAGFFDDVQSD